MRKVRLLLLSALPVAAAAVAGATVALSSPGGGLSSGPLGPPPKARDVQCMPGKLRVPDTYGLILVRNSSKAPVSIDRVELATPRHLVMTGAFLVPGNAGVFSAHGFPPPASEVREPYWRERGTTPGYRVLPGHWVNFVVGIERTANVGSSPGIEVAYHQGGNRYLLKTNVTVVIKTKCF